ncbi:MAG: ABC transporter permease, partial [Clostridia bacterium]|nr:ABC transporter permease [Clostridia bacterium]
SDVYKRQAYTYLILFCMSYFASAYIMFKVEDNGTFKPQAFMVMGLGSILLFLTFGSLGICLSAILSKARSVTPTAIGVVLGTFILGIFSGLNEKVSALKYFSPFQYIDSGYIMEHEAIETLYLLIMLGLVVASLVSAYFFYSRKDIQA